MNPLSYKNNEVDESLIGTIQPPLEPIGYFVMSYSNSKLAIYKKPDIFRRLMYKICFNWKYESKNKKEDH